MPYLTPDDPTSIVPVLAYVPNTLLPSFVGAIVSLWQPAHWEQFGTLTVPETLDLVGDVVTGLVENPPMAGSQQFTGAIFMNDATTPWPSQPEFYPWLEGETFNNAFTSDPEATIPTLTLNPGCEGIYQVSYFCSLLTNGYPATFTMVMTIGGTNVGWLGKTMVTDEGEWRGGISFAHPINASDVITFTIWQQSGYDWSISGPWLSLTKVSELPVTPFRTSVKKAR